VDAPAALASLLSIEAIDERVDEALVRFCDLLRQAPDGAAAVPGLTWTVGELGAHLVTGAQLWSRMLRGEPSPIASLSEASAHTARMIAELDERDPGRLAELLEQETRTTAAMLAAHSSDRPFPWHAGLELTMGQAEAIGLGELLVHGFDLARALQRPWSISDDDARTVIYGAARILPSLIDRERARGFEASFELRLRGGSPLSLRFEDQTLTVGAGRVADADCRISARPRAFLLLSYGRARSLPFLLRGQLLAWGRRPWLAARLPSLLQSL